MRMAAARASDYENDCKKEARAQSQHLKFIDDNRAGPGVRSTKAATEKRLGAPSTCAG